MVQFAHTGPVIDIFPEDTYAIEGEGILIPVSVKGFPKPTIMWFFEGHEMTKEHSVEVQQDGSIFISLVHLKHTGHYKLLAKNTIGSIERSFNLYVKLRELRRVLTMHNGTILKPVPLEAFGAYVAENHEQDNKGFKSQYMVCAYRAGTSSYFRINISLATPPNFSGISWSSLNKLSCFYYYAMVETIKVLLLTDMHA